MANYAATKSANGSNPLSFEIMQLGSSVVGNKIDTNQYNVLRTFLSGLVIDKLPIVLSQLKNPPQKINKQVKLLVTFLTILKPAIGDIQKVINIFKEKETFFYFSLNNWTLQQSVTRFRSYNNIYLDVIKKVKDEIKKSKYTEQNIKEITTYMLTKFPINKLSKFMYIILIKLSFISAARGVDESLLLSLISNDSSLKRYSEESMYYMVEIMVGGVLPDKISYTTASTKGFLFQVIQIINNNLMQHNQYQTKELNQFVKKELSNYKYRSYF
jgi:hypothetical protein